MANGTEALKQALIATGVEERIRTALARELSHVPADQDGAVLFDATAPDVHVMFATRTAQGWSVDSGVPWTGGRHVPGEIVLAGTFHWSDFSWRR
jgi:hypothetical protein